MSLFSILRFTSFNGVQFTVTVNHGASFPDQFVQSVAVAGFDAASPPHHSKQQCTDNNRLLENIQHPSVQTEVSQLPQEAESAYPLLVSSPGPALPV